MPHVCPCFIEAELKARLSRARREELSVLLHDLSGRPGRALTYLDLYFDRPGSPLAASDRELRLRTVSGDGGGTTRIILTYKDPPVDPVSRSKPEIETEVSDATAALSILEALGFRPLIRVRKDVLAFELTTDGLAVSAVLVDLPAVGRSFLEVEALAASADEAADALTALRRFLDRLAIPEESLTAAYYTDEAGEPVETE